MYGIVAWQTRLKPMIHGSTFVDQQMLNGGRLAEALRLVKYSDSTFVEQQIFFTEISKLRTKKCCYSFALRALSLVM